MSRVVFFTAGDRKPMKQRVPASWESKPVSQLVGQVAKSVLGHEPDFERLVLHTADGLFVDLSQAICDAMADGGTFVLKEVEANTEPPCDLDDSPPQEIAEHVAEEPEEPVPAPTATPDEPSTQAPLHPTDPFTKKPLHPSDPYYQHVVSKAAAAANSTSTALAHVLKDVNDKNGGDASWGWWEQTRGEAVGFIRLPAGTKGRHLRVTFTSTFVNAELLSTQEVLMQGPLAAAVIADDCHWEIVDGILEVHLTKQEAATDCAKNDRTGWWPCIVRTDQPHDIMLCDREPFILGEMDDRQQNEQRSILARMMGSDDPTEGREPRVDAYD